MGEFVTSGNWWQYAACRSAEPDLFFPISAKGRSQLDVARAKMVCGRCPVCSQCLDYALATGQPHGIWGGLTEIERQLLPARVSEDPYRNESQQAAKL
jgi:WhiB family transcriptional regulator, redox-sensing transcriptional regulator